MCDQFFFPASILVGCFITIQNHETMGSDSLSAPRWMGPISMTSTVECMWPTKLINHVKINVIKHGYSHDLITLLVRIHIM